MMTDNFDLAGKRFGRLVVLRAEKGPRPGRFWMCLCDCGTTKIVQGICLRRGGTKSCGCLNAESRTKKNNKYRIHGMSNTRTYITWYAMRTRCRRRTSSDWSNYGGRGIKVCDRWNDFSLFLADMGNRPAGKSLDRIDVNGDYEPGNCRWASSREQARNTRRSRNITAFGVTRNASDWSSMFGVKGSTIRKRISEGWPTEYAVTVPPLRRGMQPFATVITRAKEKAKEREDA